MGGKSWGNIGSVHSSGKSEFECDWSIGDVGIWNIKSNGECMCISMMGNWVEKVVWKRESFNER